jgi:hypothetical protein
LVRLNRRLKRQKREKPQKPEPFDPLAPENLGDALNPMKPIFPFDFPGQNGDWSKKSTK